MRASIHDLCELRGIQLFLSVEQEDLTGMGMPK